VYTASGSTNLAQYALTRGASSAIGWTSAVPESQTINWINNFFLKLKTQNVSNALTYANSQIYANSNIKNARLYSFSNVIIYSLSPGSLFQEQLKDVKFGTGKYSNMLIDLEGLTFSEKKQIIVHHITEL